MQFLLVFLGTITMFIGVTMALSQHDFKRLLAFHSISQIGYVMTAVGLSTALGITGGLYHAMNHTLFKGLLFLCAGAVYYSTGTTNLDKLGGLAKRMPQTTAIFLIGAFSISGIPPFNGFVSKWLIYHAAFQKAMDTNNIGYLFVTVIALIVSVMTLASFIKVSQSVFFGELPEEYREAEEAPVSMRIPMWIMALLCFAAGVIPQYVTKYLVSPAANAVLNIGKYINTMMGEGYAEKFMGSSIPVPESISYAQAGYWNPIAWLVLFVIVFAAFMIAAFSTSGSKGKLRASSGEDIDPKYDTFFSGEANAYSQVGGSDLFWGMKHNLRHYFSFMHNAHSGIVNDYALWVVSGTALIIVYLFIFL